MARVTIYQVFFKPAVIVPPIPAVAATRFLRINVYFNSIININVILPDSI